MALSYPDNFIKLLKSKKAVENMSSRVIFFWGVDQGKIEDMQFLICSHLVKYFHPSLQGSTDKLDGGSLLANCLSEAVYTFDAGSGDSPMSFISQSFFSPSLYQELVIIKLLNAEKYRQNILNMVDDLAEKLGDAYLSTGTWVLVNCGNIPQSHKFAQLVKRSKKHIGVVCYNDLPGELASYIDRYLRYHGFEIEAAATDLLLNKLGNNRMITKSELNKMMIYVEPRRKISEQDVEDIVSDNYQDPHDIFLSYVFGLDAYKVKKLLLGYWDKQLLRNDINILFARFLSYMSLLAKLKQDLHGNSKEFDMVLRHHSIIFFKKARLKRELALWDGDSIRKLYGTMFSLVHDKRRSWQDDVYFLNVFKYNLLNCQIIRDKVFFIE